MLPKDDWRSPVKREREGPVRTLKEVGQIMFMRGHFDKPPTEMAILRIERRALAKLSLRPELIEILRDQQN